MGFSHESIRQDVFTPIVIRVEHSRISTFFILGGPIKIDEHDTSFIFTLGCNIENIGGPQVPNDDIFMMKKMHCLLDFLEDNSRNWCSLHLQLPKGFPIHTVHNDHV